MSEHVGEKTELPTPRKLEDAIKQGLFPRSAEVQTVFVLTGSLMALAFAGGEIWQRLAFSMTGVLGHLHDLPVTETDLPAHFAGGMLVFAKIAGVPILAAMIGGLLAGAMQSRFRTASEALEPNWERLNPVEGFKRVFSMKSAVPTGLALLKLTVVMGLTYQLVLTVLHDPIFTSTAGTARIAQFLADSSFKIIVRIAGLWR